jgi:hypothetical protein
MRRLLLPAVALGLVLLLPTQALACVPIAPKSWSGTIDYSLGPQSVSMTDFTNNSCAFHSPELNGFDAIVFDVSSHKGLAGKFKWSTPSAVKPSNLYGYYRTSSCGAIQSWWTSATPGENLNFEFPNNAKWLIVVPVSNLPTTDISVTVSSPGRVCPP